MPDDERSYPRHPCRIARLPQHLLIPAARQAVLENPANAVARAGAQSLLSPQGIAALTGKAWGAKGVNLTVQFLDNPDQATRSKILSHANAWGARANVKFTETSGQGQVRITRTQGQGYWSYLGTDILQIPANQPTMNLEGFTASGTPDSEFYRVVRHEVGHTCSFPHEHTRKEIVGRIDPAKADAYFLRYDGWDAQTVQEQVLTPLDDSEITALPADVRSIMTYSLPGEIMKDGVAVPGGLDIDEEDFALAAKLYPKNGGPITPPPVKPSGRLFPMNFSHPVRRGQLIRFNSPVAIPAGNYDVVPATSANTEG